MVRSERMNRLNPREQKGGGGESPTPFIKSLLGAAIPPGAESDFWPAVLGYQKSDPGGDRYIQ